MPGTTDLSAHNERKAASQPATLSRNPARAAALSPGLKKKQMSAADFAARFSTLRQRKRLFELCGKAQGLVRAGLHA